MKRSLSLNVIDESGQFIELPDDVPLSQILPHIEMHLQGEGTTISGHLLFVSRVVDNLDQTLSELGIGDGDSLHLVRVDSALHVTKLQLYLPRNDRQPWREVMPPMAVLGRDDGSMPDVQLDIDVSSAISSEKQISRVSRRQLQFYVEDGRWFVVLHKLANAPAFVGSLRLTENSPVQLAEGNVITIGASPNQAVLQFNVRLESL